MKKQTYHYGIDLLRIVATLMIVMTHVLAQGGVRRAVADRFDSYYILTWLMQIGVYGAVNCYALISGYVGRQSQFRYSKIVALWLQVAFYTIGITLIFALLGKDLDWNVWFRAFFPIITSQYWYVTAYFGLLLFMPLLNIILKYVSHRDLGVILATVFLFACFLPALFNNRIEGFALNEGYSTLWLLLLYLLGAYLQGIPVGKYPAIRWLLLTFVFLVPINFILKKVFGEIWFYYSSPTILLSALLLFISFIKVRIGHPALKSFIKWLAPTTFGVYLIHLHPLVVEFLLRDSAQKMVKSSIYLFPILVVVVSLLIFGVTALIEALRIRFFKKLRVECFINKIDQYLYLTNKD